MENWIPWRFIECLEFLVLFCHGKRKTTYNPEQYEVVWGSIFLGINVKLAAVSKASDTDQHLFTQTELKEDIVFFSDYMARRRRPSTNLFIYLQRQRFYNIDLSRLILDSSTAALTLHADS